MSTYEIVGTLFGVLSVYLTTRENVWCWPVGIVNVATYAYVNPLVALAIGAWFGGESVAALTLVAAAISLAGVYLSVSDR